MVVISLEMEVCLDTCRMNLLMSSSDKDLRPSRHVLPVAVRVAYMPMNLGIGHTISCLWIWYSPWVASARTCRMNLLMSSSVKTPNWASMEAMDPPGTYSMKMNRL